MVTKKVTRGDLEGSAGNDNLTGIAKNGTGQIHAYAKAGNDTIHLDFSTITRFSLGHHARGDDDGSSSRGTDTFNFRNLHRVDDIIVGRIEDFDPSRDKLSIDGSAISLNQLENGSGTTGGFSWRIVEYDADSRDSATDIQQWILINTGQGYVFYALEGARVTNGNGAANGGSQEAHFIGARSGHRVTDSELDSLPAIGYVDPQNHVPAGYSAQGGISINDDDGVYADAQAQINGTSRGDLIAAGLNDDNLRAGSGNDRVWGGSGNDTINGDNGNDTILGGTGNDSLKGSFGKDHLRGNEGNDTLKGQRGDDHLLGDEGDDSINAGSGHDTLEGGSGVDILRGWTGNDTFLFHDDEIETGETIADFQYGSDIIAFDINGVNSLNDLTIVQNSFEKRFEITVDGDTLYLEQNGFTLSELLSYQNFDFL